MHCYLVVLACLAVAVPSVLSLNCCIPELVEKIQALSVRGVLEQEKSFGKYRGCVVSDSDADRFRSVHGRFNDEEMSVTVDRKVDPVGIVTRNYFFENIGDYSFDQVDKATNESFSVYNIFASPDFTAKYGCKNSDDCADGSDFLLCVFPPGSNAKDYQKCQAKLDEVVSDYITTKNICTVK